VVRHRQAARVDRRAELQPLRSALPQPSLRAALPALRAVAETLGQHAAKSHGTRPKLAIVVCTRSHLILSTRARTGFGSTNRDFEPLLFDACRRHPRLRTVLADAGYDSEANRRIARHDMGVRSMIKTGIGRPSKKPPSGYYRHLMSKRLKGSQKGKTDGKRSQGETVNSMLKRNQGDALRARSPCARRNEQLLRVLTHNIALLCDEIED
jgi:hypothetical protein